jgi:hypothetical protein
VLLHLLLFLLQFFGAFLGDVILVPEKRFQINVNTKIRLTYKLYGLTSVHILAEYLTQFIQLLRQKEA